MGSKLSGAVAVGLVAAVGITSPATAQSAGPVQGTEYEWNNVEIVGGGFVPGFVFNRTAPDLVYARTDIGGAYRWDPDTQRWIPLLDWVGWDEWGYTGVVSLASDAVDPDRVYAAVGTYTNDWDPNNGAVLRSTDRGESWQVSPLPFKQGGNMPGRGMGERLAVDPNDNRILYLGAPSGHGLWRSGDHGETWQQVTDFPNPGTYVENPDDTSGYASDIQGVVWVTFDPRTGSPGNPTQTVYVGVADLDSTVYRTTDGGASWEEVPGAPSGHLAQQGALDEVNGYLFVATNDRGGPYDGDSGDVWRFDTATEQWDRVSPVPSTDPDLAHGYSGLTLDRQSPGTLMVTSQISWWPDETIFRSTDSGQTWSRIWEFGPWPERVERYQLDASASPWLTFGQTHDPAETPERSPKLGWMMQGMEIDPHNSDRFLYGTGATIYGSDNLTAWDRDELVQIRVMAHGLEETSIQDLISPPAGVHLISAVGDLGGFVHEELDRAPELMFQDPYFSNGRSVDYAELAPEWVVRTGQTDREGHTRIGFSDDGGQTWWQGTEPDGTNEGGTAAIAADGSRVVWSPGGAAVHWTDDGGASWQASDGVPAGARVASDRVDPAAFYAFAGGTFYTSQDGGVTFQAGAPSGLPAEGNARFAAVPGHPGHVWFAGGSGDAYGMWHSVDGGVTFQQLAEFDEADAVGFGKAAPGAAYPAIYTTARLDGVRGIFRSDDGGASWVRINDDDHQWAWTGAAITGDPRVYGRVYIATNGRGIIFGDPLTCQVRYQQHGGWPGGFISQLWVTNTGPDPVHGWTLEWSFDGDQQIDDAWGVEVDQRGPEVSASNLSWNQTLLPGRPATFGFTGTTGGVNPPPGSFTLNGGACTVS